MKYAPHVRRNESCQIIEKRLQSFIRDRRAEETHVYHFHLSLDLLLQFRKMWRYYYELSSKSRTGSP